MSAGGGVGTAIEIGGDEVWEPVFVDIVSGHDRKKLVVVHLGANDVGKVYSEDLNNTYRIPAAESKGL